MMSSTEPCAAHVGDVVVGVDRSASSMNALRWARSEARRLGATVDVVEVGHDRVVDSLVAAGDDGSLLVVGSDRRREPLRLLTGNVTTGVAARCSVPVVSVPGTWRQRQATGVVLVGVKHPHHSEALMAEAYTVALERGSRLVVLHAQRFPCVGEAELADLVTPWQRTWPAVDVEVRLVQDLAAPALVTAAAHADELVLVRRTFGIPTEAHLGPTARTVLLHAPCPVRVVPGGPVLGGVRSGSPLLERPDLSPVASMAAS
jgi:nucleotide-binding universal stress UspA family protein